MKKLLLIVLLFTGCKSEHVSRIITKTEPETPPVERLPFHIVSCCRDNDGLGNLSYPSFVPQAHQNFCQTVRFYNHIDQPLNDEIYLAVNVDCGHGKGYIGDEFYAGKGY